MPLFGRDQRMSKLVSKSVAGVIAVAILWSAAPATQSKFTLKVHTGRGQVGYDVNSTMISGERDMVVIDPQFSLSEAHKLAAEILESKKRLTTVYSTHPHPDHLFGSRHSPRRGSSRCRRP
jgi:glyoxylase-like metal-dependent hydrolase (beta-lactamase superfamily II)